MFFMRFSGRCNFPFRPFGIGRKEVNLATSLTSLRISLTSFLAWGLLAHLREIRVVSVCMWCTWLVGEGKTNESNNEVSVSRKNRAAAYVPRFG